MQKITPVKTAKGYKLEGRLPLWLVNPDDVSVWDYNVILWFGAYAETRLRVWARGLEEALETAAEWLAEHEPGQFTYAENDEEGDELTYTESGYLVPWEWGIVVENPNRYDLLSLLT